VSEQPGGGFLSLLLLGSVLQLYAQSAVRVTVVAARAAPVYREVVRALDREGLKATEVYLDRGHPEAADLCGKQVVALGPTARRFVAGLDLPCPVIWGLCLGPDPQAGPGITLLPDPGAQMRLLKHGTPFRRLGVIYTEEHTGWWVEMLTLAAKAEGMTLEAVTVKDEGEAIRALALLRPKVDALFLVPDPRVLTESFLEELAAATVVHGTPVIGFARRYLDRGAVISLGLDPETVGRLLARSVRDGRPPENAFAHSFNVWVDARRARRLGLVLDPDRLRRLADGEGP